MNTNEGPPLNPRLPLSIDEQIDRLVELGMDVPDRALATRCLSNVSYHKLSAYWERFRTVQNPDGTLGFGHSISFSNILNRYLFDQGLRSLLLEAFSYIEVSIKTKWAYELAFVSNGGRFAHLDSSLFSPEAYSDLLSKLTASYAQQHPKEAYDFNTLPIWEVAESLTFGQISRWYKNIKEPSTRQSIAYHYDIDEIVLASALRHLTPIRNICAHHERLWDRRFKTKLKIPNRIGNDHTVQTWFNIQNNSLIYNSLVMVAHLMSKVVPHSRWKSRLTDFLNSCPEEYLNPMGFPEGWSSLEIWEPTQS